MGTTTDRFLRALLIGGLVTVTRAVGFGPWVLPVALGQNSDAAQAKASRSSTAAQPSPAPAESPEYQRTQARLAEGWNTWDVHSVTTQVLLPEGLAIHIGLKHNGTLWHESFLSDSLIGRQGPGLERVVPGPHAWDGSYSDLRLSWQGHNVRIQSAHEGKDLVLLATPLPSSPASKVSTTTLPPTIVLSVNFLWNRPGTVLQEKDHLVAHAATRTVPINCTCAMGDRSVVGLPIAGRYFALDFTAP
ncbi:MAG: hypothetical protein WB607_03885, partial [Candidatus Acidiferrum sp.]